MRSARLWEGKIEGGRLHLFDRPGFDEAIKALEGREVELTVTKRRKHRSLSQNAWYWSCIVATLAAELGYDDPEDMHQALKEKFLRDRRNEVAGLVKTLSTADLDTIMFGEYCEQCIRLASEMGIKIPMPEERHAVCP